MNKELYGILEDLQDNSNQEFIERVSEKRITPGWQVPFYLGVVENEEVVEALEYAKQGMVEKPKFLDPGCGSGFAVILASQIGYDSYGIDLEKGLVELAEDNVNLSGQKGFDTSNIKNIVQGDLSQNKAYDSLRTSFSDIDVFFTYFTRGDILPFLDKYEKEAKPGSKAILVPHYSEKTLDSFFKGDNSRPEVIKRGEDYQIIQK